MAVLHHDAPTQARPNVTADTWSALRSWAADHDRVHIDLGTGDGRYAVRLARVQPGTAVIGLDTNLDHLRGAKKRHPGNLRFVTADALGWPLGALPAAETVTVNFPYGSLLRGVVEGDPDLIERFEALLAPCGRIEVRVNASALVAGGITPEPAPFRIASALRCIDGLRVTTREIDRAELRMFPSSWARRLGHGKPTRAWLITGCRGDRLAVGTG